jgi:prepilin-type N-terminal cleavage/methylation domain-containing protein
MFLRNSASRRDGFTLVELLIAVSILLILAGLTLGIVVKSMVLVRKANTERTMQKVHERFAREAKRIADEVRNLEPPPLILEAAGGDRRRARVILHKLLLKWSFPMSFDEIQKNAEIAERVFGTERHPAANYFQSKIGSLTGNLELTNSICAALIYERLGGLDDLSGAERSTQNYRGVSFPVLLDGFGMPMRYYRWPLHYPTVTGPNLVERSFPTALWGTDPEDPEHLLDLTRPENVAGWRDLPMPNTTLTCGQWFEDVVHLLPRPQGQRPPIFAPMTLVSHGPDTGGGTNDFGLTPNDEHMSVSNPTREGDNLYSFRSRISLSGQ